MGGTCIVLIAEAVGLLLSLRLGLLLLLSGWLPRRRHRLEVTYGRGYMQADY